MGDFTASVSARKVENMKVEVYSCTVRGLCGNGKNQINVSLFTTKEQEDQRTRPTW